jgi:hypothetical protein
VGAKWLELWSLDSLRAANSAAGEIIPSGVEHTMWILKFISGKYQGGEFPLRPNCEMIIGRSSDLDIVLAEEMVSRRHAKISTDANSVSIQDLGSTNGTFVNGENIRSTGLKEDDRILVGTSIIELVTASGEIPIPSSSKHSTSEDAGARERPAQFLCLNCWDIMASPPNECPECHAKAPGGGWKTLPYQFTRRFAFKRQLGRGGMGAVFLAEDGDAPPASNNLVAIKVAQSKGAQQASDPIQGFFPQEVKYSHRLSDYQEEKDERAMYLFIQTLLWEAGSPACPPYLVMEYLASADGWETLEQYIQRIHNNTDDPAETPATAQIGLAVLQGVIALEKEGIVHRDLKPANIFIRRMGDRFDAKIGDLGIATDARQHTSGTVEAPGESRVFNLTEDVVKPVGKIGTLGYMSPEQCNYQHLTCRSDIFSLGSVLWQTATGRWVEG